LYYFHFGLLEIYHTFVVKTKKPSMNDHKRSKTDLIKELHELRENFEEYRTTHPDTGIFYEMLSHSPVSIQVLNNEGLSVSVNAAHSQFFGAKPPGNYNMFNDSILLEQGLGDSFAKLRQGEAVFFPDSWYNAHLLNNKFPDKTVWIKTCGFPLLNDEGKAIGYVIMHENISERKKLEEELEEKNASLRGLYNNFQMRIEETRKSLAAELHDNLIQDLTAHKLKLASIKRKLDKGKINEDLSLEMANVNNMIRSARNILTILWPTVIDNQGIAAAIEGHSVTFSKIHQIKVIRDLEQGIDIPKEIAYQLFMLFQEALTNIAKHSRATQAKVSMKLEKNLIHFLIADNGKGIKENKTSSKKTFGLLMMKDITNSLGGEITITKGPVKGTIIDISVPLKKN
jgi:signal transduction histidine kinase